MTETTSNPMIYPSERGPGHGVWRQTSRHRYSAFTIALITLNGALTTLQTITQTIEIGDDPANFRPPRRRWISLRPVARSSGRDAPQRPAPVTSKSLFKLLS